MNFRKRNKPVIDILFILGLLGLFVVCSFFTVLFGAKIYKSLVNSFNESENRIILNSYITNKIKAADSEDTIEIKNCEFVKALVITDEIEGENYSTYIYCYNGYLKEYTALSESAFNVKAGSNILPVTSFIPSKLNNTLFKFSVEADKKQEVFYVNNDKGGSNE